MEIIKCEHLSKSFGENVIFDDFNMSINSGDFVSIMGPSGCGKTTLLNMLGLLDTQTKGDISLFKEKNVNMNSKKALLMLRNKINFVFQNYGLIDDETVYSNLKYALAYCKNVNKKQVIEDILKKIRMEEFVNHKIYSLSGGQQQRVALARVLLKPGELILADEPTGNLDAENTELIFGLLKELNEQGKTIVMVTHNKSLAEKCKRIINL